MDAKLIVSEVFGPTVQGEGPSTGVRAAFIRLGRCNLDCRWCDTPYTWDWHGKTGTIYDPAKELHGESVDTLVAQVSAMSTPLVVVTGGEPLLQGDLASLCAELIKARKRVEVETNGTRDPGDRYPHVRFNVSPKLASSGVAREKAWHRWPLLSFLDRDAIFKFVIGTLDDLAEVVEFLDEYRPPRDRVWLMAQTPMNGVAPELAAGEVAAAALDLGVNISGRLHVELWGNERGH